MGERGRDFIGRSLVAGTLLAGSQKKIRGLAAIPFISGLKLGALRILLHCFLLPSSRLEKVLE